MSAPKKISFGFSKSNPKSTLNLAKDDNKNTGIEFISHFDDTTQKSGFKSNENAVEERLDSQYCRIHRAIKKQSNTADSNDTNTDNKSSDQSSMENDHRVDSEAGTGRKPVTVHEESTIEDYETHPISDFGVRILKSFGWNEKSGIGRKPKVVDLTETLNRSIILGQNQLNQEQKTKSSENGPKAGNEKEQKLEINDYVKIIKGDFAYHYGQIEAIDENTKELTVKIHGIENLQKFSKQFLVNISQSEFKKSTKVLNIVKYEQYKGSE